MSNDPTSARESRMDQGFRCLQQTLTCVVPVAPDQITPARRFTALIAPPERRRVWQQLGEAGFELPELGLSGPVFLAVASIVVLPLAVVAFLLKTWSVFLSVGELGRLAYHVTRPWAVHPPLGCETVQEAVLCVTPFRHEDYHAGRWPREDIAAKVRWIVAQTAGVPFSAVTEQTRLNDVFC